MNLAHVLGLQFAHTDQDYEARDSLLYALSLGMGTDPLDRDELPFVFEGLIDQPQLVVPSQCMVLGWQRFWQDDPDAGIDWQRIVHGEEHFEIHAPIPAAGRVRTHHRLVSVQDKGPGRGIVLQVDTELFERDAGTHLASLKSVQFLRGDGGCGAWGEPGDRAPALPAITDDAEPIASVDYTTSPQAALLYRVASRDWMPIHADPEVARAVGFERPISHGLNNLGRACRAVLKLAAPGEPTRLRALAGRFVQPGLPGDTVRIELFEPVPAGRDGARTLQFRATAIDRDVRLIDRGLCRLEAAQ